MQQRLRSLCNVWELRGAHLLCATLRNLVFLFRGHKICAVKRKERLTLFDQLPDVVDVALVDVPVDLHVDMRELRLIAGKLTGRTHSAHQRLPFDGRGSYANQLLLLRCDLDGASGHLRRLVIGVLGDQLHATIWRGSCLARFVGRMHRVIPEEDLPYVAGLRCAGCRGTLRKVVLGVLRHQRSEEHTSELQSRGHLVCRLLLEKKKSTE